MPYIKDNKNWKSIICGDCPCFVWYNDEHGYELPSACTDLPCVADVLRGYLAHQNKPTRAAFVEAIIELGVLNRKQIFSALQEFMGVKSRRTCEWHLQNTLHKMRERGRRVKRLHGIYRIQGD